MTDEDLRCALEAVLTVALEPVPAAALGDLTAEPLERVVMALHAIRDDLSGSGRGFIAVELASGWRLQTNPAAAEYVQRFALREVSTRLSTAALETLAIVAYRQPVSRSQISALRGVNVDGVVRLLEQRGYIEGVGRAEGPGLPILYGTTELFLDRMGLVSLDQLPRPEALLPDQEETDRLAAELDLPAGAT
jgi:segregation and condensation protein B